jgi:hypothetical protein
MELNAQALAALRDAAIELHTSDQHMRALLAAHELHEWGSTLAQAALSATRRSWELPHLLGAPHSACMHACM